jgi:flagellar motor switch/type III secretory pathway protein FliN
VNDADLMDRQAAQAPPRRTAATRHTALGESPWLRSLSGAQAAWTHALAGCASLRCIAAARWPEAKHWPSLCIDLAGCAMTLRLAPHAQWAELGEAASAGLADELYRAIAAHLTQGLRQSLGDTAHQTGLIAENSSVPLHDGDWPTDEGDNAALLLALTLPMPGDAGLPPCVAWLRVPAQVAPPCLLKTPAAERYFDPALPMRLVLAEAPRVPTAALRGLLPGSVVLLDRINSDVDTDANADADIAGNADGDGDRDGDSGGEGDGDGDWDVSAAAFQARLLVCDSALGHVQFEGWHARSLGDALTSAAAVPPHAKFMHWAGPACQTETTWSTTMSDALQPAGQTLATALSQASTTVEAVIDMPPMRLSELQSWTPGVVLRTQADIAGAHVLLRVAGKAVARGRLIAIDSLLGLELTELFD